MECRVGINKEDNLTVRTIAGWSAGKMPGLVLPRYDSLGTNVRGRLQYAY